MRNITRASLLASIISAIELYEDGPQPTAFRAPRVRKSRRYPEQSSRQASVATGAHRAALALS